VSVPVSVSVSVGDVSGSGFVFQILHFSSFPLTPTLTLALSVFREQAGELCAASRFLHHGGDGVAPFCVVRGFFVRFRCCFIAIDLDQYEPRRIVRLLHDIESRYSWLSNAIPRVFYRRFNKISHGFSIHVDLDMDDKHGGSVGVSVRGSNLRLERVF
jgi:hypothetical protein